MFEGWEERFRRFVEEKVLSDKNIERFVKYYWIVSTLRMVLGFSLMMLILLFGYRLWDLVPHI